MQINRLFEIVYILLEKETVSARELAEHFEVSTRTIYRDVEILSSAGIPVYMSKGRGGGIRLLSNFVLNKAVLTKEEKGNILFALQSLNTVDEESVKNTLHKLGLFLGKTNTGFIEVDYSAWGNQIKEQFEQSKKAILNHKLLSFDYVSAQNERTKRTVEPYVLCCKGANWYLKSFCIDRQEIRIFRLTRMREVTVSDVNYIPRTNVFQSKEESKSLSLTTRIRLRIEKEQQYRVMDEFSEEDVEENEDGSFTVTMNFVVDEWVYGYILSFGKAATVLEPEYVRTVIKHRLKESLEKYL